METIKRAHIRQKLKMAAVALAILLALSGAERSAAAAECYPRCNIRCQSLVDGLKSVGAEASFSAREIIASANGIADYTGSAAQNILLLDRLKQGTLCRPDAPEAPALSVRNADRVRFIPQDKSTCKATAVAMAVNLLRGNNNCTTASMGGSWCESIQGQRYTGSDGKAYTGVYHTDSYTGSASELSEVIDGAIGTGVPIVVPVHSVTGGTRHHWVVVLGKSGEDYQIADPAWGTSGTVAENVSTLSARNYALGLDDYAPPHYGYVTFIR